MLRRIFMAMLCLLLAQNMTLGASPEDLEMERQEYRQDLDRIAFVRKFFTPGPTNDLDAYERFADALQHKWSQKNREYYARLMLAICGPLSSGDFKDDRRHELARKYVLSALETPEAIPVTLELELARRVITLMSCMPDALTPFPKGADFAQHREKDVQIRLHAWKRLMDAIDPNWVYKTGGPGPNAVAANMGFPGTIPPESIKDPILRAKYVAAMEKYRQEMERDLEQIRLRKWLRSFPPRAEKYIIMAYSRPPFDLPQLNQYLQEYIADKETRTRILDTVTKNMEK